MGMIELETDTARNVFFIRYFDHVSVDEMTQRLEHVLAGIENMRPGFGLLADLTNLTKMDIGCAPLIETTMDAANKRGIAAVVRVIPDSSRDIGMKIMSLFHYGPNVHISTCATIEEAMKILFD